MIAIVSHIIGTMELLISIIGTLATYFLKILIQNFWFLEACLTEMILVSALVSTLLSATFFEQLLIQRISVALGLINNKMQYQMFEK